MSKVAKEGFIPNLPSNHRHSISKMKNVVKEGVNPDPQDKHTCCKYLMKNAGMPILQ